MEHKHNKANVKKYTEAGISSRFERKCDGIKWVEVERTTAFNFTENFCFVVFRKN
jgi:hypothetical protein